ncbi:MAG: PhoH family protein, partial [Elusimicrobia bacterium]|nr:PhoH family protein [Elusimicrobiota bacterium]
MTKKLHLFNDQEALLLLGEQDARMRQLEREFGVELYVRHDPQAADLFLSIRGSAPRVAKTQKRLKELLDRIRAGQAPAVPADAPLSAGDFGSAPALPPGAVFVSSFGKAIAPRSPKQQQYVEMIRARHMVFGVGPAGTGKTFLAVACALASLKAREVNRIVLTRPVVEAGEKLGFLPGDLYEKVHPYLKPLYDAFHSMLGPDKFRMWRDDEIVEIVPLAYMRGRTLENAFIILDEAQNTTPEQMKMFLTRMGTGSRVVVTGDMTQIDLQVKAQSGLIVAKEILRDIADIGFLHFSGEDIVRHELVKKIIHAYDRWDKR